MENKNQFRNPEQKERTLAVVTSIFYGAFVYEGLNFPPFFFKQGTIGKYTIANDTESSQERVERYERTSNVEYMSEQLDRLNDAAASLGAFSDVFARFNLPPEERSVRRTSSIFSARINIHTFSPFIILGGQIIRIEQR